MTVEGLPAARTLWTRVEVVHAITYFAEESIAAARATGLRGFWMGYFGFRASPLGEAGAAQVCDAFYNFAPAMVERSIPDVWEFARPEALVDARAEAAATALRRLAPPIDDLAPGLNDALRRAVEHPAHTGFPLYSANRALPRRDDPVEELWQLCTTLREHRGDGHVAALRDHGISGCEAHILFVADSGVDVSVLRDNRGWSEGAWDAAAAGLIGRGLLDTERALTPAGRAARHAVEARTDATAMEAWSTLSDDAITQIVRHLSSVARAITERGPIPFPNPMGLPKPIF